MTIPERVAILIDGGFVTKVLRRRLGHFPSAGDVENIIRDLMGLDHFVGFRLHRVFYYDAEPWQEAIKNPITGETVNFRASLFARQYQRLLQQLELKPDFAVRRGILACHGWKVGRVAMRSLAQSPRPIEARDLQPDFEQKGVDMRIGLDLASLALKRHVSAVILVTGDSDLVPAMKFARQEGLRVYLHTLESAVVRPELRIHADIVLTGGNYPSPD